MTDQTLHFRTSEGIYQGLGTFVSGRSITFALSAGRQSQVSVILYRKGTEEIVSEIPVETNAWLGEIRCIRIDGIHAPEYEYNYRIDGKIVTDPAARIVTGRAPFGYSGNESGHKIRGGFLKGNYRWEEDQSPSYDYSDVVAYGLHVRGFTMGSLSGVRHPGTFTGIREKIPYLTKLGINQIILMPAYEFDEIMPDPRAASVRMPMQPGKGGAPAEAREAAAAAAGKDSQAEKQPAVAALNPETEKPTGAAGKNREAEKLTVAAEKNREAEKQPADAAKAQGNSLTAGIHAEEQQEASEEASPKKKAWKINYWGYGKAWYYAPKYGYCSSDEPDREFKDLVKALHKKKIELLMEFSFPDGTDPAFAEDVLSFWVREYHVDGFRLLAGRDVALAAASCPLLSHSRILYDYFDPGSIPAGSEKHLSDDNNGFRTDCRRFLKGDENTISAFIGRMSAFSDRKGIMNSITGHDGFTLMDLVSYDGKHNEENGEQNQDGAPSELSWNCGAEGATKKKQIRDLRLRQMKNALTMLLTGQGTPVILAGDEHGNTQNGNNNPYCIDSEVTWLDWKKDAFARELTEYTQKLIALRKKHQLLRGITQRMADLGGSGGFPAFSTHGSRAWYCSGDYQDRHVGMMYCGREDGEDSWIYLAFNLHWDPQSLALPYLPEGVNWKIVLSSAPEIQEETALRSLEVPGRTVMILEGIREEKAPEAPEAEAAP